MKSFIVPIKIFPTVRELLHNIIPQLLPSSFANYYTLQDINNAIICSIDPKTLNEIVSLLNMLRISFICINELLLMGKSFVRNIYNDIERRMHGKI